MEDPFWGGDMLDLVRRAMDWFRPRYQYRVEVHRYGVAQPKAIEIGPDEVVNTGSVTITELKDEEPVKFDLYRERDPEPWPIRVFRRRARKKWDYIGTIGPTSQGDWAVRPPQSREDSSPEDER